MNFQRLIILIIVIIFGIGVFLYIKEQQPTPPRIAEEQPTSPTKIQKQKPDRDVGSVNAVLVCTNQEIQSEVVFVTTDEPLIELQCQLEDNINVPDGYRKGLPQIKWYASSGELKGSDVEKKWVNPEQGLQNVIVGGEVPLTAIGGDTSKMIHVPFEASLEFIVPEYVEDISSGIVNGFEVGKYPDPTDPDDLAKTGSPSLVRNNADAYQKPKKFYEISPETWDKTIYRDYELWEFDLDPRFTGHEMPRYIALTPQALKKIGLLEDRMNADGVAVTKFNLIYGFRSPKYNLTSWRADGEDSLKSPFSMHMYGKAVDFIVDEDEDFVLDDLNGDGKTDVNDAYVLSDYVGKMDKDLLEEKSDLMGARFVYYHHDFHQRGAYAQTPYVHMDVRNYLGSNGIINGTFQQTIELDKTNPYQLKKPIPHLPFQRMFERLFLR